MFKTVSEIIELNKERGRFFFSPETMMFFSSRIEGNRVYGTKYFVTSEQFESSDGDLPREYTVRAASDDGDIKTIERFPTKKAAVAFAKKL